MNSKRRNSVERTYVVIVPLIAVCIIAVLVGFFNSSVKEVGDSENTGKKYENFNPNNFDDPTNIDNEWMPLRPGMQLVYEGTTLDDEGELQDHRVVINVTDLTKVIEGVRTVVSWDLDYSSGELTEAELAFFAQDDDGNVWRMGEYPEEYEDGEIADAPCWITGIKGSIAGISMKFNPELGTPSYSQGYAPDVEFTDRGQVDQIADEVCVPVDCYENVLVISETSEAEPDANQLKYFARSFGNIKVGWKGDGEKTQEVLELVKINKLSSEKMEEVREKAMELEKSAYEQSKDVYGLTSPLEIGRSNVVIDNNR